ncbi:membrane integrity-associated transporter subunit PqiC [Acetobacteraceae bacterium]|nr:membrane integrity-associated transporter subunit PqiC [Acetobacteraceae bacterium]
MNWMKTIVRKPALGISFLGFALAGCFNSTPHFYSLVQKPMQVVQESEKMGPIKVFLPFVPASLDRDVMVKNAGPYQLTLTKASWSEPLPAQIAEAFKRDLAQALPNELVYRQNNMVAEQARIGVDLSIDRFSLDEKGYAVLDGLASFTLHDRSGKRLSAKTHRFSWKSEKTAGSSVQTEIDLLSQGIANWAQDTANFMAKDLHPKADVKVAEISETEKEADEAEKEMRQAQMISSANQKLAQEQKKMEKTAKKE